MAGHSKWAQIKRKKAVTDNKRGKLFTKLLKEVQVAAKMGGGDPTANPRLRAAILGAKSLSVPNDNIDRAINRGSGDSDGTVYEEILYEGYGAGGVAILVQALTDNKNRTVAEVRHAFSKCNGNLASSNSVAYLFNKFGIISVPKPKVSEDEIFEISLEAGADDVRDEGDVWEIVTEPKKYHLVLDQISAKFDEIESSLRLIPETSVQIAGKDAENVMRLVEMLEDLDDVQSVTANFEIDDAELEALSS